MSLCWIQFYFPSIHRSLGSLWSKSVHLERLSTTYHMIRFPPRPQKFLTQPKHLPAQVTTPLHCTETPKHPTHQKAVAASVTCYLAADKTRLSVKIGSLPSFVVFQPRTLHPAQRNNKLKRAPQSPSIGPGQQQRIPFWQQSNVLHINSWCRLHTQYNGDGLHNISVCFTLIFNQIIGYESAPLMARRWRRQQP